MNFGIGFNALSGTPLTPFAANPLYDSDGEILEAPRGAGIETVDGFRQRTPWMTGLDLPADYALRVGGERRVLLLADVFQPVQPALAPRLRQLHGGGVWSLEPRLRARHPVSTRSAPVSAFASISERGERIAVVGNTRGRVYQLLEDSRAHHFVKT